MTGRILIDLDCMLIGSGVCPRCGEFLDDHPYRGLDDGEILYTCKDGGEVFATLPKEQKTD